MLTWLLAATILTQVAQKPPSLEPWQLDANVFVEVHQACQENKSCDGTKFQKDVTWEATFDSIDSAQPMRVFVKIKARDDLKSAAGNPYRFTGRLVVDVAESDGASWRALKNGDRVRFQGRLSGAPIYNLGGPPALAVFVKEARLLQRLP